jgi:hypothetical protein
MKSQADIYRALLKGKRLKHRETGNEVWLVEGLLSDIETFDKPEDWKVITIAEAKKISLLKRCDAGVCGECTKFDLEGSTIGWCAEYNATKTSDGFCDEWKGKL